MYECCCSKFLTTVGACSNIDRASGSSTHQHLHWEELPGGKGSLYMAAAVWAVCFGGLELSVWGQACCCILLRLCKAQCVLESSAP